MNAMNSVHWIPAVCVLSLFTVTSNALAQRPGPLAGGGATVQVTPDGGSTLQWEQNTGGHSHTFFVKNVGTTQATYTITCFGRTNVTCTQVTPSQVTLNANAQVDVEATYSVQLTGTGRLVVRAENGATMDTGYVSVPVIHRGAPPIALRHHNGDNRDRSLCLVSGAGEAAGVQCGDLLITHSMPAYATLGRDRSPTLLYSSHQAAPRPLVAVTVTQGGTLETPTSVFAKLSIGTGTPVGKDSATWTAWGSHFLMPRQLVLGNGYDASTDSSGIYPFTFLVRNIYTVSGRTTRRSRTP